MNACRGVAFVHGTRSAVVHGGDMDGILSALAGNNLVKAGTAVLTTLLVVPAVLKLFVVTVDEGWAAIRTRNGKPIVRRATRRAVKRGTGTAGEVVVLSPGSRGAFPLFYWYRLIDVRCRATDLPARQLTGASGHQHLVHASFEWRPIPSGRTLRAFELDVVNLTERAANIVGAALRDVVRRIAGPKLSENADRGRLVLGACAELAMEQCGVEIVRVMVTGDALTDGYLLSEAILHGPDHAEHQVGALHVLR